MAFFSLHLIQCEHCRTMFLYGAAVLVLLIIENAAEPDKTATASRVSPKNGRPLELGELAELLHRVRETDEGERESDERDRRAKEPYRTPYTERIDLDYVDVFNRALKLYKKGRATVGIEKISGPARGYPVIYIKNPQVLEQYRKNLSRKRYSTSSSSSEDSDSLEDNINFQSFVRRNAVFRLVGSRSDKPTNHWKLKSETHGNDDRDVSRREKEKEAERYPRYGRNDENAKEKIVVSFKDKSNDYNDNSRYTAGSKNKNNEKTVQKDLWDIAKEAFGKWDEKIDDNQKHFEIKDKNEMSKKNNYDLTNIKDFFTDNKKIKEENDYGKKEKYDDYGNLNKPKESKWEKNNGLDKTDNSWDSWKPKSMVKKDLNINDDWQMGKSKENWDKLEKNNDWNKLDNKNYDTGKKTTKGVMSSEQMDDDYMIKDKKEKKTTREWDRPTPNSSGSRIAKKPNIGKFDDYYNPKPRNHENSVGKSFGRTSIPFVGKKGIYEEK